MEEEKRVGEEDERKEMEDRNTRNEYLKGVGRWCVWWTRMRGGR